jgi:diacylglycerol O-acyltransferase / wax synthase
MERMNTLDAGFFFAEQACMPMHLGALALFEGPAPSYHDLVGLYAARLSRVPRYRQVVRTAPLQMFRPVWADDEHFEIGHHLRCAAVRKPGRAFQLHRLAGEIYAQPLDRSRPLWEAWLLDGIEAGRWAILSKVHHCMVDGIGGADLMAELFDLRADSGPPLQPAVWQPQPGPSLADALVSGLRCALTWPLGLLVGVPALVRQPMPARNDLAEFARGLHSSARRLMVPSASCLNGPTGPSRRWTSTTTSLNKVKQIRAEHGVSVNDVLLAAVTRGYRDLLMERRELSDGMIVRTLVPISIRCPEERGVTTNRLSAVLANLPVAESDPIRRLQLVRDQMQQIKRTNQAVVAELLTQVLGATPPTLLRLGASVASRFPQSMVQTMTTNVPGPGFPLYVLGRKMVHVYPYAPVGDNVKIAIAIFSYLGELSFGITADSSAASDVDVLVTGIRRGLTELQPATTSRADAHRTHPQDAADREPDCSRLGDAIERAQR